MSCFVGHPVVFIDNLQPSSRSCLCIVSVCRINHGYIYRTFLPSLPWFESILTMGKIFLKFMNSEDDMQSEDDMHSARLN